MQLSTQRPRFMTKGDPMRDGSLTHDLPVWIPQPLDQGSAMPLRLHFCDDKLLLTVELLQRSVAVEVAASAIVAA
jgi:hypothetical protein